MSREELAKFIHKVETLKELVDSLQTIPARRQQLMDCKNHDQVVKLAKSWGYEIGRRWGDSD